MQYASLSLGEWTPLSELVDCWLRRLSWWSLLLLKHLLNVIGLLFVCCCSFFYASIQWCVWHLNHQRSYL